MPVDSVEIKEPIIAFAWEPIGNKFAITHGEQNSQATSFWGVMKGHAPTLLSKNASDNFFLIKNCDLSKYLCVIFFHHHREVREETFQLNVLGSSRDVHYLGAVEKC